MDSTAKNLINKYQYPNKTGDKTQIRTTSNVGKQDDLTLEDASSLSELSAELAENTLSSLASSVVSKYASGVDSLVSSVTGTSAIYTSNKDPFEDTNGMSSAMKDIENLRDNISFRKTIKTSALIGTYNSLSNLVGLAGIICAGSLGSGQGYSWSSSSSTAENILKSLDIGSGVLGLLGVRATTKTGWTLDSDEIAALNSVTYNNFFGNKPGLKTGLGSGRPARHDTYYAKLLSLRNELKSRKAKFRTIGRLYIEPYYNDDGFECFSIPFEFNPSFSEGSIEAKYNATQLMNRVNSVQTYISTESSSVQIETTYLALAADDDDDYNKLYPEVYNENYTMNPWMYDWTNKQLEKIELQLRSLVMPSVTGNSFVRPPIVQIVMEASNKTTTYAKINNDYDKNYSYNNTTSEGDLFKYPYNSGSSISSSYLQSTNKLDGYTRRKRYVVTSVQISPLDDFGTSYTVPSYEDIDNDTPGYYRRNGFKVSLSLTEVTKNFTDIVPDYKSYYNAWSISDIEPQPTDTSVASLDTENISQDELLSTLNENIAEFWSSIETWGKYVNKKYDTYDQNLRYHKYLKMFKSYISGDASITETDYLKAYVDSISEAMFPDDGDISAENYYKKIKSYTLTNLYEKVSSSSLYNDMKNNTYTVNDTSYNYINSDEVDEFYNNNIKIMVNASIAYYADTIVNSSNGVGTISIGTNSGNTVTFSTIVDMAGSGTYEEAFEKYKTETPKFIDNGYGDKIASKLDTLLGSSTNCRGENGFSGDYSTQLTSYSDSVSKIISSSSDKFLSCAQYYANIKELMSSDAAQEEYDGYTNFEEYIKNYLSSGDVTIGHYIILKYDNYDSSTTPFYCPMASKFFLDYVVQGTGSGTKSISLSVDYNMYNISTSDEVTEIQENIEESSENTVNMQMEDFETAYKILANGAFEEGQSTLSSTMASSRTYK